MRAPDLVTLLVAAVLLAGAPAALVADTGDATEPAGAADRAVNRPVTPEETAGPGLWGQTLDTASDWWNRSRELATQAAGDARSLLEPGDDFGQVWEEVIPTLDDTLALEQRHQALPEKAWFGPDQSSNQEAINALLDDAVSILATSPVQRYRERIRTLEAEIEQARGQIAEYRQLRVSAPRDSAVKRTVSDYDRLIGEHEEAIDRKRQALRGIRRQFAGELRGMGLEISDEQVELLLSTVVGDNMVDLGVVFDNVRAITEALEGLVAESGEDLASARRYYGLYVVLLQSLDRMHLQVEESIGERFLPELDAIIERAQDLAAETQRLRKESPDKQALLDANLEAQQVTIAAAGLYRQYLIDQAEQVRAARAELEKDIAAAWNTYETVQVSGELVNLVKSSQHLIEGLMNRQVPVLRPFENLEMQRELQKLTEQLRGSDTG